MYRLHSFLRNHQIVLVELIRIRNINSAVCIVLINYDIFPVSMTIVLTEPLLWAPCQ